MKDKGKTMDTEVFFVLDASGSMYSLRDDTIGGLNAFVDAQRKVKGKCRVTVRQFNDESFVTHDNIKLKKFPTLVAGDYTPSGCTALYDAIGHTIAHIEKTHGVEKPKIIVVIVTDGWENASKEWTHEGVQRALADHDDWEVVFLGANIDSKAVASSIGVAAHKTMDYSATVIGTQSMYESVSQNVANVRSGDKEDMAFEEVDMEKQREAFSKK